jgi:hypothetical protein
MKTRNSEVLKAFVAYCEANPSQRFWQALLNFSGLPFILISNCPDPINTAGSEIVDPYNWEDIDG